MSKKIDEAAIAEKKHNASRKMTFDIYRFNPETDEKPSTKTYKLDLAEVEGSMLLNALETLKRKDPTLGVRRSCGEGVCGSDGMQINGKNGLACITQLKSLPNHVSLRPLPGFPVIRDLIVDMTRFYKHFERVKPYLINNQPVPATERLQSPEDRAKLDGLYECILCACCTSSCPSYWWNADKFMGPAAALTAYRFIIDSRDTAKSLRLEDLQDPYSIFRCRTIYNCTSVCPKGLNPSKAIAKIRDEMMGEAT